MMLSYPKTKTIHIYSPKTHTNTMHFPPFNKMSTTKKEEQQQEEEDYIIDMELRSQPPQQTTKDFEFQILTSLSPNNNNRLDTTTATFPADELFYKGKLLPLLLPSRRQMLRNLTLVDFTKMPFHQDHINYHSMPSTHTLNTPSDSCNISPSQSCRVSCDELNPDHHHDFFFQWSTQFNTTNINNNNSTNDNENNNQHSSRKKQLMPWPKRLKLGNKLRSTRAYLKALFSNKKEPNNCSSGRNYGEIANECRKNPTIAAIMESAAEYRDIEQRRSFSSAIKRHYPAAVKCLSSSSSSSSNSFHHELRRSSNATEEIEGSIEAAIAHCKNSVAHNKLSGFCSN